jgi:hypothetical protein
MIPKAMTVARVQSLLNRLGRLSWNVRIQQRYPHGVSVAGYLARYMTGGPISNRRIHSEQFKGVRTHKYVPRPFLTLDESSCIVI